jgi:hypothetical protein
MAKVAKMAINGRLGHFATSVRRRRPGGDLAIWQCYSKMPCFVVPNGHCALGAFGNVAR